MEQQSREEQLQAENDFLKLKLMLEKGAKFQDSAQTGALPPEVENQFLKNIIEFERQFDEQKTIRIVDKIRNPQHFKPPSEITDDEAPEAWAGLLKYLNGYGIHLDACSPKVTKKELYRFAIEELFQHEITDMHIPGMMHGFIYDEFYPDYEFENTRLSVEHAIRAILRNEPLEWLFGFFNSNLRLNEHYPLTEDDLLEKINRFKSCYDEIDEAEISNVECVMESTKCRVSGVYAVTATLGNEKVVLAGNWQTYLEMQEEIGYWYIHGVEIQGIRF